MTDEQKRTPILVRADLIREWPRTGEVDIQIEYPGAYEPIIATVPGGAVIRGYIDFICDGPPSHESGRFVEVENERGFSIRPGEWVQDGDLWRLRVPYAPDATAELDRLREVNADLLAALDEIVAVFWNDHEDCRYCDAPEGTEHNPDALCGTTIAAIARARGENVNA